MTCWQTIKTREGAKTLASIMLNKCIYWFKYLSTLAGCKLSMTFLASSTKVDMSLESFPNFNSFLHFRHLLTFCGCSTGLLQPEQIRVGPSLFRSRYKGQLWRQAKHSQLEKLHKFFYNTFPIRPQQSLIPISIPKKVLHLQILPSFLPGLNLEI